MKIISSTYPAINEILDRLLTRVQEILGYQFIGMYLHGSLANGGFDEHSDIDVIVVTDTDLREEMFLALREMHAELTKIDSSWAIQLEVSYIPQDALRHFDPANKVHPHIDRGSDEILHRMAHESDWVIQRHTLRERGITIAGPSPKTLIDPVSPDNLRQAILGVLPLWLTPILNNPSVINKRGYQSFFVLSLCRMLYTLKYGTIISKLAAARWGKGNLDPNWASLIERAVLGRQDPTLDAQPEDIIGTLDMMRYVLQQIKPTPYPDVNEVLNLLLARTKDILDDQFVGMYLYGSLSSGDFDPESSDIDFLVVTTHILSENKIAELKTMHNHIWATGFKWASKLEGAYVPKEAIRHHDPKAAHCPSVNEEQFSVARLGNDWIIQRHIIRECGVVLAGPDPKMLIDPVSADDLRCAVLGILQEWWFPMLGDSSWLSSRGSEYQAFAVISMCRALHSLEHGNIASKPKAVQWAREKLGEQWLPLIDKAIVAARHENQDDFLEEALDFIRFTKEQTTRAQGIRSGSV